MSTTDAEPVIEGRVRRALASAGLDADGLRRVQQVCATGAERPVIAAARLGLVDTLRLAKLLASEYALERPGGDVIPGTIPADMSPTWLRRKRMAVLQGECDQLPVIGIVDPSDTDAMRACRFAVGGAVRFVVLSLDEWKQCQAETGPASTVDQRQDRDSETLADLSRGAPAVRLVEEALAAAQRAGASDIHFRPRENGFEVLMRVDGELQLLRTAPLQLAGSVAARLKVLAGLDLAERRAPQDGRLSFTIDGSVIDARLSTVPNVWGEGSVVRLLGRSEALLSFDGLGFSARQSETVTGWLSARSGLIMVAGPTGAGKTTTLYAAINALRGAGRNILTVEDPVEYLFEDVSQTQVDRAAGVDFSSALRAFLRHDPDVIMVGEIRDAETAALAVRAALTGHLVLTSIHAENAPAAIVRLIDLGVERFLAASTLRGVVAQRLTRRLCPACGEKGCEHCGGTGRRGRIGVIAMMSVDDTVRQAIMDGADAGALGNAARSQPDSRMSDDALAKADAGLVDRAEALASVS
ncbi:type II secretion system protein E [Glycocaulis albus]|uniref:Type II secretion system protein E n=1 Tax=Glycocaulis albus TaxID=1382801 RepID=A0ABQ1Y189_9PROT|nr:GspE/PulE family protein [Glycocaulis albus]GGH08998.1 type II secretion system protein E [Glycocaulis albus]